MGVIAYRVAIGEYALQYLWVFYNIITHAEKGCFNFIQIKGIKYKLYEMKLQYEDNGRNVPYKVEGPRVHTGWGVKRNVSQVIDKVTGVKSEKLDFSIGSTFTKSPEHQAHLQFWKNNWIVLAHTGLSKRKEVFCNDFEIDTEPHMEKGFPCPVKYKRTDMGEIIDSIDPKLWTNLIYWVRPADPEKHKKESLWTTDFMWPNGTKIEYKDWFMLEEHSFDYIPVYHIRSFTYHSGTKKFSLKWVLDSAIVIPPIGEPEKIIKQAETGARLMKELPDCAGAIDAEIEKLQAHRKKLEEKAAAGGLVTTVVKPSDLPVAGTFTLAAPVMGMAIPGMTPAPPPAAAVTPAPPLPQIPAMTQALPTLPTTMSEALSSLPRADVSPS